MPTATKTTKTADSTKTTERTTTDRRSTSRKSWREVLRVHPVADLSPLLSPDELTALAADIRRNGLIERVVTWHAPDGTEELLDGRNRLDALELLGTTGRGRTAEAFSVLVRDEEGNYRLRPAVVAPPDPQLGPGGEFDPVAFILATNVRRHQTLRQRVVLAAKVLAWANANNQEQSRVKRGRGQPKSHVTKVAEAAGVDPKTARKHLEAAVSAGELTAAQAGVRRRATPTKPHAEQPSAETSANADHDWEQFVEEAANGLAARLVRDGLKPVVVEIKAKTAKGECGRQVRR